MAKSISEFIKEINAKVEKHKEENIQRSAEPFLADTTDTQQEYPTLFNRHPQQDVGPERRGLLPIRHSDRDFFLCGLFDYALKDDHASMEAPMFTLSTKPDLNVWHWISKDGKRSVTVTPSILGRATQHDKDVLIYLVSQLTEALNRNRDDTRHRTVRFTVYDYLVTTNKLVGGKEYQRLEATLERLRGTNIKTNIRTAGVHIKKGFGLIDQWEIIEKSPTDEHMIAVEVTLSEWLSNAVQAHEVLTLHPDYFRLRKPIARRLYELARKHCGHQSSWRINLDLLHEKTGSQSTPKEFRRMVKAIEAENSLPDYSFVVNNDDKVTFCLRA
jgi:plasmid replication initiation protein